MNADLHCHSTVSDGTLEPEALAARAKANGVELWALTDHDELGGQQRARASPASAPPATPRRAARDCWRRAAGAARAPARWPTSSPRLASTAPTKVRFATSATPS